MIKSFILAALLALVPIAKAVELPTNSAEIYAVWVEGEMVEVEGREKMRSVHTPTPLINGTEYLGVNIPACEAPDGGQYGVNWPIFTEEEKSMWEHILVADNMQKRAGLFQGLINGVEILWDQAELSDAVKENWKTKLDMIARDCFPPVTGA